MADQSKKFYAPSPQAARLRYPASSSGSEMLTPSELEQLRKNAKEQTDFAREEFGLKE
jgi:hypothetical protein